MVPPRRWDHGERGSTLVYIRKDLLVEGEVYHIFNKSIARFKIFSNDSEFSRMTALIRYYQREKPAVKFSKFLKLARVRNNQNSEPPVLSDGKLVEIIAFCVMPTHIHLVLKQLKENGISIFMSNVLNSYTRYFNTKHKRKGPLWEGRFKNVLIKSSEQLLHLTRYIHLNPLTAHLVEKPEEWSASSYGEYSLRVDGNVKICKYDDLLQIEPLAYREFLLDRALYQRDLAKIKDLLLE
jgi:putative transposase